MQLGGRPFKQGGRFLSGEGREALTPQLSSERDQHRSQHRRSPVREHQVWAVIPVYRGERHTSALVCEVVGLPEIHCTADSVIEQVS
jgi:hypothetical protein